MATSTFTIGGTTATFNATIIGSQQESGDLEHLTLAVVLPDQPEWVDFLSLVTTKYHVHAPMSGNAILDIVRGLGIGTLTISGLGATSALLVGLRRTRYLRANKSLATAEFLVTAAWT